MNHRDWHLKIGRRRLAGVTALVAAAATLAGSTGTGAAAAGTTKIRITPAYDVLSAAQAGMQTLMGSYNPSTGLIGNKWWQSAVALSTLMDYQQATGDFSYDYEISTAFDDNKNGSSANPQPNFEDSYMDDTGWWGLTWLQAYQLTGYTQYLQMAETDANYIHQYWDGTCNGGVWWNTSRNYKNAITNELFLELTAGLHNEISGDTTYLNWANSEWSWLSGNITSGSGLISNYQISDGRNATPGSCGNMNSAIWTYNQGVILAGLVELSYATGNSGLLDYAQNIADTAILNLDINGPGVLNERCTSTSCGSDAQSFKGIFASGLKDLWDNLYNQEYASFFENQVNSIIPNDTNSAHQMGFLWQGPVSDPNTFNDGLTSYSQASAEQALVDGLDLGDNGTILAQRAGMCADDYGSGQTDGNTIDVWACNSSPAQSWSVPPWGSTGEMQVMFGCATVNNSTADGTRVVWDTCTDSPQQQWTRLTSGSTLYNPWSGKCMDNTGNSGSNGNPIQIWDCLNDRAQTWYLP